jgi:exopolyphosphatase/guanosine-5'-triphosphate,3'-diphosphate pyrophosphatase
MSPTSYQTAPPRGGPYVLAKNRPARGVRATAKEPSAPPHRSPLASRAGVAACRRVPTASTIPAVRVAVVDIGTNSTRLLVADVDPDAGSLTELVRRSEVTRLGHGVDASGHLSDEAIQRVFDTLASYRADIDAHGATANLAVLTSAVRDAANGPQFAQNVRDRYHLDARVLSGDEEAQLTFLGAMAGRPIDDQGGPPSGSPAPGRGGETSERATAHPGPATPTVVIDIGGGSTEFVVGAGRTAGFHTSLPAGVVRMSERHIHSDPPAPHELQALARDVHAILLDGLPKPESAPVTHGIAVAGTATSAAAIDLELDPYDPARVHGYTLELSTVELLLARLADMTEDQRRLLVGLHPDRAPTIVAGMILLEEALRAFELQRVEVSEHDILYGGALQLAGVKQ